MSEGLYLPPTELCIVLLHYDGAQGAIEAIMAEHLAWLTRAYAEGGLLLSGRRSPWTGGVLLVRGDRTAAEAVIADAPFVTSGLARAEVIPFVAGMAAAALHGLAG